MALPAAGAPGAPRQDKEEGKERFPARFPALGLSSILGRGGTYFKETCLCSVPRLRGGAQLEHLLILAPVPVSLTQLTGLSWPQCQPRRLPTGPRSPDFRRITPATTANLASSCKGSAGRRWRRRGWAGWHWLPTNLVQAGGGRGLGTRRCDRECGLQELVFGGAGVWGPGAPSAHLPAGPIPPGLRGSRERNERKEQRSKDFKRSFHALYQE